MFQDWLPKINYLIWFFLVVVVIMTSCENDSFPLEISILEACPDTLTLSHNETSLVCVATDFETGNINIAWSAEQGTFPTGNGGPSVIWRSPEVAGLYCIKVEAYTDNAVKRDSLLVVVIGNEPDSGMYIIDSRDGNRYDYIQIGDQYWLTENLAYLPSLLPGPYGSLLNECYYVMYNRDDYIEHCEGPLNSLYYNYLGALYNWRAALNACPDGWHLPSDEEWKTLEYHLGMNLEDLDLLGERNSGEVGRQMKSTGVWGIFSRRGGSGDNSSGMNVLSGGARKNTETFFMGSREYAYFWTSTESENLKARYRKFSFYSDGVHRNDLPRDFGLSIRCLKN